MLKGPRNLAVDCKRPIFLMPTTLPEMRDNSVMTSRASTIRQVSGQTLRSNMHGRMSPKSSADEQSETTSTGHQAPRARTTTSTSLSIPVHILESDAQGRHNPPFTYSPQSITSTLPCGPSEHRFRRRFGRIGRIAAVIAFPFGLLWLL